MAKRHKGTTRTAAKGRPTTAQAESPQATGAELLGGLDRERRRRLILDTLNALRARTVRTAGPRCMAFSRLDLVTQYEAAELYLIELRSMAEIRELLGDRLDGVQPRVLERWISIVKAEYVRRLEAELTQAQTDADLAHLRGDLPALAKAIWSELAVKVGGYIRGLSYADLDNNTRHLLARFSEGLTDAAKSDTESERTRWQTEKIRRQLLSDAEREAGKHGGKLTYEQIAALIGQAVGLPAGGEGA